VRKRVSPLPPERRLPDRIAINHDTRIASTPSFCAHAETSSTLLVDGPLRSAVSVPQLDFAHEVGIVCRTSYSYMREIQSPCT
jgi:hypothetical protein